MQWRVDDAGQRVRVVEEQVLLAWWRDQMQASPVHFYRMRKAAMDAGMAVPEVPARFKSRPRIEAPTRAAHADDYDESVAGSGPTLDDVIAELPEFAGQPEHAALIRAMEDTPPACDGLEMFTADKFLDPEHTQMMRGICRTCPLLKLCRAFAIAGKPAAGMWGGLIPADIRRLNTPKSAAAA